MSNTDDLIASLAAQGATPAPHVLRRFLAPLIVVAAANAMFWLVLLGEPFAAVESYGPVPMIVKWGFSLPLVIGSAAALYALGKPGHSTRARVLLLTVPFALAAVVLIIDLAIGGGSFPGATWDRCLLAMGTFGPICFAGAIVATRWLAPTELRKAGAVAGIFGGSVAMSAYAPFCPELGMAFMTAFYILPILAMSAIGWLAGPKLLRW
jgi:hypothetical protein